MVEVAAPRVDVMGDTPTSALKRPESLLGAPLAVAASTFAINPVRWRIDQTDVHRAQHPEGAASDELPPRWPDQRQRHHERGHQEGDDREGEPSPPPPRPIRRPERIVGVTARARVLDASAGRASPERHRHLTANTQAVRIRSTVLLD